MEEEGKVAVDVDVEEKVQEEALSLLLQGKFQDCYLICQRFFNARLTESRSTLLPTVDFDAPPKAVLTPCVTHQTPHFHLTILIFPHHLAPSASASLTSSVSLCSMGMA